jgi:hypothetical protein
MTEYDGRWWDKMWRGQAVKGFNLGRVLELGCGGGANAV